MTPPPRILAIAGSDSSGGAGIQADIKTITMLGGYAMSAVTAVTAQDTLGVRAVEVLSPELVGAQIDACTGDIGVDAIKIGMLGSVGIARAVADRLERLAVPIVFDPVMIATSGAALADAATITGFERLMRIATLTTPNVAELAALGGDAGMAARGISYLAKGGDAEGEVVEDRLVMAGAEPVVWRTPRIATCHAHGTGCTLSSAIAVMLARGEPLPAAIGNARRFVHLALHDAPGFGSGSGPLGHAAVRLDPTGEPRLNQITLPAIDYGRSVDFYRTIGLVQIVDSPADGHARFESAGGAALSIATCLSPGGSAGVYLECLDLDGARARLAAAGIRTGEPVVQPWRWRESWLSDPAGNRICLYTRSH